MFTMVETRHDNIRYDDTVNRMSRTLYKKMRKHTHVSITYIITVDISACVNVRYLGEIKMLTALGIKTYF